MENEISILVVEDEALIAHTIKMQLEDFGYAVSGVCYNYNDAVKAIKDVDYDVFVTDINLGKGIEIESGIQLALQVKEHKNCPIIFLTAFSDKDTIQKASVVKPSAYLVKPITAANLFAAVQIAVNNFTSIKERVTDDIEQPQYFFVKTGSKIIKVFWEDIYHLESIKNYVQVSTVQQSASLLVRGSLQHVMQGLMPLHLQKQFIKINRAQAIRKDIILTVKKDSIETKWGTYNTSGDFDKKNL